MADNPRIDELRKRLEREPGSRLFAQLAEELRKEGDLADAIRVCREGLPKHPQYPSARMTLGRALFDTGDLAAARTEFQAVLKGAPDNILAARLLAECLDGLEDWTAAQGQYKKALMMAPGDKQLQARLEAIEARLRAPLTAVAHGGEAEPAPIKLATVDEPMELEKPFESRPTNIGDAASARTDVSASTLPVALAQVGEEFELERPHEAPSAALKTPPPQEPDPSATIRMPHPPPDEIVEFDEAPTMPGTVPEADPVVLFDTTTMPPSQEVEVAAAAAAGPLVAAPVEAAAKFEPAAPEAVPETPSEEIASVTLADLYARQGFRQKAAEVLEQLLAREPGNERAQARLRELSSAESNSQDEAAISGARRVVIQRTIDRLEALLAAIRKG